MLPCYEAALSVRQDTNNGFGLFFIKACIFNRLLKNDCYSHFLAIFAYELP